MLFSNSWLSNWGLDQLETKPRDPRHLRAKTGIVLTGIVEGGINIDNQTQLNEGADRLTEAIKLLRQGTIQQILISGGAANIHLPEQNEGRELYELALDLGVMESQLVHENQSRNTHENAKYCREILPKNETSLLITSAYHMSRAAKCFEKQGIKFISYPVDYKAKTQFQWDYLLPSINALEDWNIICKELVGLMVYRLAGYI